jgi:hypothetical protein
LIGCFCKLLADVLVLAPSTARVLTSGFDVSVIFTEKVCTGSTFSFPLSFSPNLCSISCSLPTLLILDFFGAATVVVLGGIALGEVSFLDQPCSSSFKLPLFGEMEPTELRLEDEAE